MLNDTERIAIVVASGTYMVSTMGFSMMIYARERARIIDAIDELRVSMKVMPPKEVEKLLTNSGASDKLKRAVINDGPVVAFNKARRAGLVYTSIGIAALWPLALVHIFITSFLEIAGAAFPSRYEKEVHKGLRDADNGGTKNVINMASRRPKGKRTDGGA